MGTDYFGFGSDDPQPTPNRAQRRAAERKARQVKRRGNRAFQRSLAAGEGMRRATLRGDLAATEALK
jgi:hypothetical protein